MAEQEKPQEGKVLVQFVRACVVLGNFYQKGTYPIKEEVAEAAFRSGLIVQPQPEAKKEVKKLFSNLPTPRRAGEEGAGAVDRLAQYEEKKKAAAAGKTGEKGAAGTGKGKGKGTPEPVREASQEELDGLQGELPANFPHADRLGVLGVTTLEDTVDQLGQLLDFDFTEAEVAEIKGALAAQVSRA